jgi:hypothetical protein
MKRVTLTLSLFAFAVGGSLVGTFSESQVVYAQCSETKQGKSATTTDGTLVCDGYVGLQLSLYRGGPLS